MNYKNQITHIYLLIKEILKHEVSLLCETIIQTKYIPKHNTRYLVTRNTSNRTSADRNARYILTLKMKLNVGHTQLSMDR